MAKLPSRRKYLFGVTLRNSIWHRRHNRSDISKRVYRCQKRECVNNFIFVSSGPTHRPEPTSYACKFRKEFGEKIFTIAFSSSLHETLAQNYNNWLSFFYVGIVTFCLWLWFLRNVTPCITSDANSDPLLSSRGRFANEAPGPEEQLTSFTESRITPFIQQI